MMTEYYLILDRIMASFMLRRVFQRSFSRTTFQRATQQQIVEKNGKIILKVFISIGELRRCDIIKKRK